METVEKAKEVKENGLLGGRRFCCFFKND